MLSMEFEVATPAIKQLQTYTLDRRSTGMGRKTLFYTSIIIAVSYCCDILSVISSEEEGRAFEVWTSTAYYLQHEVVLPRKHTAPPR
jgi:hypothetical protein